MTLVRAKWLRTALLLFFLVYLVSFGFPASFAHAAGTTTTTTATQGTVSSSAGPVAPTVKSSAAILMDASTGRVLFEKNADQRRSIASTTKIMTCLIAIETLPLDQEVTVSARAAGVGESEMWLEPGEVETVETLLYGLMVKSGNDAAMALAEACSGSVENFVAAMNAKAKELGLKNTRFANPHGLEVKGKHYSTARDMANLARYALQNPEFRKLVDTEKINLPWPGHTGGRTFTNYNTLLPKAAWVNGVKTGYTAEAGWCLVGSGTKNGTTLVSSVYGDVNRDDVDPDTLKLLNYGFGQYTKVVLGTEGQQIASLKIPYHYGQSMALVTSRSVSRSIFRDDATTTSVQLVDGLTLPVKEGTVLGTVSYEVGGATVDKVDLVATRSVGRPTLGVKFVYYWDRFAGWLKRVF